MGSYFTDIEKTLFKSISKLSEGLTTDVLSATQKQLFEEGFELFKTKGILHVRNTFAGGIIFLREPENIREISLKYDTQANNALATVTYESGRRNARNVKYKPGASQSESAEWNMTWVFPNFNQFEREVVMSLITLIGEYVKSLCEHLNETSWFTKYQKDFQLNIYLDEVQVIQLPIACKLK